MTRLSGCVILGLLMAGCGPAIVADYRAPETGSTASLVFIPPKFNISHVTARVYLGSSCQSSESKVVGLLLGTMRGVPYLEKVEAKIAAGRSVGVAQDFIFGTSVGSTFYSLECKGAVEFVPEAGKRYEFLADLDVPEKKCRYTLLSVTSTGQSEVREPVKGAELVNCLKK